jgi:hypothetical protein
MHRRGVTILEKTKEAQAAGKAATDPEVIPLIRAFV